MTKDQALIVFRNAIKELAKGYAGITLINSLTKDVFIHDDIFKSILYAFDCCEIPAKNLDCLMNTSMNFLMRGRFLPNHVYGCLFNDEYHAFLEIQPCDEQYTQFLKNCGSVCFSWMLNTLKKDGADNFYVITALRINENNWEVRIGNEERV